MKKYSLVSSMGFFVVATITIFIITSFVETLTEENLLCFVPFGIIGFLLVKWILEKISERKRIETIRSYENSWGKEFCDWLVNSSYDPKSPRVYKLAEKIDEWGMITVMHLLNRSIGIGMTAQMTSLSLGKPNQVDMREFTSNGEKYRWIYGIPRKSALYIWFNDHKVSKIKYSKNKRYSNIGKKVNIIDNFYTRNESQSDFVNEKNPSRERIPDDVQIFVWQRDQGKCVKCGSNENLEFDHIIPLSKGGSNSRRNIQLLCENCNRRKSAKIGG